MNVPPRTALRLLLALSGWIALLESTVGPTGPLRIAVTAAFLLVGPGTAMLLAVRPAVIRTTGGSERLAATVLALALSASTAALAAEAFFEFHAFTVQRVLASLAFLTTGLSFATIRERPNPGPESSGDRNPPPTPRLRSRHHRFAALLVATLLLALVSACSGAADHRSTGPVLATDEPAATSGADGETPSASAPGPWHSVFRDDFTNSELDKAKWTTCYDWNDGGCTNSGNHEPEWYLPHQVSVANGQLTLTAARRSVQGSDGNTYPWVSGMVSTGKDRPDGTPRRTFTYGYFAAAVQLPARASGFFPAFWLAPLDSRSQPDELDVAEFAGSNQHVDMNLHFGPDYGHDHHVGYRFGPADFAAGYHVFAMDWEPHSVTWYIDGLKQFEVTDASIIPRDAMELIIDLAVSPWTQPPSGVDSAQLHVKWVQVWQH